LCGKKFHSYTEGGFRIPWIGTFKPLFYKIEGGEMEFSKKDKTTVNNETHSQNPVGINTLKGPEGSELVDVLSSLSGLPEGTVASEIQHILGASVGEKTASSDPLTLDQLRSAMLTYLEAINEEMTQLEQVKTLEEAKPVSPFYS